MTLNQREAAILTLYTGVLFCNFSEAHKVAEELYGGPIFTHQFADPVIRNSIKDLAAEEAEIIFKNIKYTD